MPRSEKKLSFEVNFTISIFGFLITVDLSSNFFNILLSRMHLINRIKKTIYVKNVHNSQFDDDIFSPNTPLIAKNYC